VREQWEQEKFCLGMDDEPAESSWVRVSRQVNIGDVVMAVCYSLPDQGDQACYR